jgi:hypothetical protein
MSWLVDEVRPDMHIRVIMVFPPEDDEDMPDNIVGSQVRVLYRS